MQGKSTIPFFVVFIAIAIVSALLHWRIFNLDLMGVHVWRQTQTQSVIENFSQEDFNILHPRINNRGASDGIFRMEFPIMQWLFACFYRIFGNHLCISRILSFLTGLASVSGVFFLVRNLFQNSVIAAATAWCFNFSPIFYYYTMNPLPDNFALALTLNALALLFAWRRNHKPAYFIASAILFAIGALAKLPFILYGTFWAALLFYDFEQKRFVVSREKGKLAGILLAALVPFFAWYASVIPGWKGNGIVAGMLSSDISFHDFFDILQHHLVSTLPELLINYGSLPLFLAGIYSIFKLKLYRTRVFPVFLLPAVCVAGYFFFEINMIAKVHDYYLFPFLPFIFLTVALGFQTLFYSGRKQLRMLSLIVLMIIPVTAFLRADSRWNEKDPGFNADLLRYKNELRAAVPDNALCITGNDVSGYIFLYYIGKKGWNFKEDQLDSAQLSGMIEKGAAYLYCDSRKVDENEQIRPRLRALVGQRGSIRVYALK